MIFRAFLARVALRRVVLAATAAHQPSDVRGVLSRHGHLAFATAVSSCRPEVVAKVLSLLPQEDSSAVIACLPVKARERFMDACEPERAREAAARHMDQRALQGMLVWSVHA